MQINGADNHNSLYYLARRWAQASTTDFPVADFIQSANVWLGKVVALIMRNDNTWEFDDLNQTDLPVGSTDLVAAQDNYAIASTHLKILRVRVKDPNGNWITLQPVQRRELTDDELLETGTPRGYDKLGNSLFLIPMPNYASEDGLECQFQRGANLFAANDTTKEPGFANDYHEIIALGAALDFCDINGKEKQAITLRARIGAEPLNGAEGSGLMGALAAHYRSRDYDRPQTLTLQKSTRARSTLL